MKNFFALIASACLSLSDAATATELRPVPRMTGQEFVDRYFNRADLSSDQQSAQASLERDVALGYLAGVADAAQGTAWCDKGLVKTIEIDAAVAHSLRRLPPESLRRSAAPLIVDVLTKRYPCR